MTTPSSAFPGAEGYGSTTTGGRGGSVLHVTTLADGGEGSLRWALSQFGARTIVFDISGSIQLKSELLVQSGDLTIAGQTAPGEGITIEGSRLRLKASNIIVRGMHFRPGDGAGTDPADRDGMMIGTTDYAMNNIVIDHNSFTWATDENLTISGNVHNVTVSNNIIAEGLSYSINPKGEHSKGLLITNGGGTQSDLVSHITVAKNLFAGNNQRNPEVRAGQNIEIINNLTTNYGLGHVAVYVGAGTGGALKTTAKIVGNVITPGLSTNNVKVPIAVSQMGAGSEIFIADNLWTKLAADSAGNQDQSKIYWDNGGAGYISGGSSFGSGMNVLDSTDVTASVLANVGTAGFSANSVDARIVREARDGTGHIIDRTAQVGGMPSASGVSMAGALDTDRDGMPDWFEDQFGFNKLANDGNGDSDGDGYTNIEEYLNGIISGFDIGQPTGSGGSTGPVVVDLSLEGALGVDRSGPVIAGDAGNTTFTVNALGSWLEEGVNGGVDLAYSSVDFRLSDNVENLSLLQGSRAISATGNDLNNVVAGNELDNVLVGLDGDDTLRGMAGNDRLNGGGGSDLLQGKEGDDTLMGGAGADQLYGGIGNDIFRFAAGDANFTATVIGDNIADYEVGDRLMLPDGAVVDVRSLNSITISEKSFGKSLAAAQASFGSFGGGPLVVKGTTDSYVFWSTDGNASNFEQGVKLTGLSANVFATMDATGTASVPQQPASSGPVINGTAGNDTFMVNTLGSWLDETVNGGVDLAYSSVDFRLSDNVENLSLLQGSRAISATGNDLNNVLAGNELDNVIAGLGGDDTLRGMAGNDTLNGGGGNDMLQGKEGDDTLMGGAGADQLYGGTGNDIFRFVSGDANFTPSTIGDVIADFEAGDRLMLSDGMAVDVRSMRSITISEKSFGKSLAAAQASFASFGGAPLVVKGTTDSYVFWSTDSNPATFEQGVMLRGLSASAFPKQ